MTALDLPTMRRWNLILRVFICEYLGLKPDANDSRRTSIHRSADDLVSKLPHHTSFTDMDEASSI